MGLKNNKDTRKIGGYKIIAETEEYILIEQKYKIFGKVTKCCSVIWKNRESIARCNKNIKSIKENHRVLNLSMQLANEDVIRD